MQAFGCDLFTSDEIDSVPRKLRISQQLPSKTDALASASWISSAPACDSALHRARPLCEQDTDPWPAVAESCNGRPDDCKVQSTAESRHACVVVVEL